MAPSILFLAFLAALAPGELWLNSFCCQPWATIFSVSGKTPRPLRQPIVSSAVDKNGVSTQGGAAAPGRVKRQLPRLASVGSTQNHIPQGGHMGSGQTAGRGMEATAAWGALVTWMPGNEPAPAPPACPSKAPSAAH